MVLELLFCSGSSTSSRADSRIAAEIRAELVDLVEQEQRIGRARLLQVGDDLARQRADVGPAVAADFGFVAHSAQ